MLFVGTSIIHPSTEGVFLLCNILDLLIYRRERILAFIIENKIMSVDDIINFLEWLVHRNPSENFYLARLKWNKDIEFLRKYKPIEGIVRIGNIYQKKVLTQI